MHLVLTSPVSHALSLSQLGQYLGPFFGFVMLELARMGSASTEFLPQRSEAQVFTQVVQFFWYMSRIMLQRLDYQFIMRGQTLSRTIDARSPRAILDIIIFCSAILDVMLLIPKRDNSFRNIYCRRLQQRLVQRNVTICVRSDFDFLCTFQPHITVSQWQFPDVYPCISGSLVTVGMRPQV